MDVEKDENEDRPLIQSLSFLYPNIEGYLSFPASRDLNQLTIGESSFGNFLSNLKEFPIVREIVPIFNLRKL